MKVWIFQTYWDYDGGAEITKVFDSKEKAEKWKSRMEELCELHNKFHRDGTVEKETGSTSTAPCIQNLRDEAGSDGYLGNIVEREVE